MGYLERNKEFFSWLFLTIVLGAFLFPLLDSIFGIEEPTSFLETAFVAFILVWCDHARNQRNRDLKK